MNKYIGEWHFDDIIAHIDKFELGTKIKSERGDIYILSQAEGEGKQRKFSRWDGTKLRFMTYENIGRKFEILEDNTEEIEEIKEISDEYFNMLSDESKVKWLKSYIKEDRNKINELVKAVNKLRKENKK